MKLPSPPSHKFPISGHHLPPPPRWLPPLSPPTRLLRCPPAILAYKGPPPNAGNDGGSDHDDEGRVVEENMVVLRMRIRELKAAERCDNPPPHWMEWEKRYYAHNAYGSHVCHVAGSLQNRLMESRPSLAVGAAALVLLSLLFSAAVVLVCGVGIVKGIVDFVSWLFFLNW